MRVDAINPIAGATGTGASPGVTLNVAPSDLLSLLENAETIKALLETLKEGVAPENPEQLNASIAQAIEEGFANRVKRAENPSGPEGKNLIAERQEEGSFTNTLSDSELSSLTTFITLALSEGTSDKSVNPAQASQAYAKQSGDSTDNPNISVK